MRRAAGAARRSPTWCGTPVKRSVPLARASSSARAPAFHVSPHVSLPRTTHTAVREFRRTRDHAPSPEAGSAAIHHPETHGDDKG
ncbi:hypothetical protein SSBG_05327 [Streptomyces sp. SPB074]|nr:hypothetical protein SSBG_05327 [Streptomyces sp. SPB074]